MGERVVGFLYLYYWLGVMLYNIYGDIVAQKASVSGMITFMR